MKKLINLLLVIFLSLTLNNCKKKKTPEPSLLEQLPERTENGEERLVGIVNNEYIFSNNGIPWVNPVWGLYSWYTEDAVGELYINGVYYHLEDNLTQHREDLFIEVHHVYGVGEYEINQRNDGSTGVINTGQYHKGGLIYHSDSAYVGLLTVTKFDTASNIYSGTFNLNLINDETQQTITITNGWFDITD